MCQTLDHEREVDLSLTLIIHFQEGLLHTIFIIMYFTCAGSQHIFQHLLHAISAHFSNTEFPSDAAPARC